jgi:hypothetical protein
MLEYEYGIDVACNFTKIFGKLFPTKNSGVFPLNTSQGGISNPPPITVASILTYTNPEGDNNIATY